MVPYTENDSVNRGRAIYQLVGQIDGTVDGAGPSDVSLDITIHAAANSRIFSITGGGNVTLDSLTLTGGNTSGGGGSIRSSSAILSISDRTAKICAIAALAA